MKRSILSLRNTIAAAFAAVVLVVSFTLLATPAFAATCGGVETSVEFNCPDEETNGIWGLLAAGVRFLTIGVGIAVTGGIIWGGLTYATARGNSAQTQKGITIITNAVIGLLLYLFMFALAQFLIPGGVFG